MIALDHGSKISLVAWTIDLGPLVRVQKQLWRGAFFTELGVYLEAILAFVLATEQSLPLAAVVIIIAILVAQLALIYHPARLLLRGELVRRYWIVSDERPRSRAILLRSRSDYRLAFRLFGRLLREDITSPGALQDFLERTAPMVTCSPLPNHNGGGGRITG